MRPLAIALLVALALVLPVGAAYAAGTPLIEGPLDSNLRSAVERAFAPIGGGSASRFEARRRAQEAGEAAIAVLRSEGYYAQQVQADVRDEANDLSQPVVKIDPGQRFTIIDPQLVWAMPMPDAQSAEMATNAMRLMRGSPGRAEAVLSGEGRIIAVLQLHGYADALANPRQVVADFADHSLRPTYNIVAGPRVLLGQVQISAKGRTNPVWVAGLAPWTSGQPYAPDPLAELERRLRETGVFDQISVALAPVSQTASTDPRPVLVSLVDRAPRTIELGAGFSTSEGAGLDARYVFYNRLRRADTTTFTARLAQIETKLDGEIALPQWGGPQQTLKIGAALYRENTYAYEESGFGARVDVNQRYGTSIYQTSYRTFGASLDVTHTRQKTASSFGVIGESRNLITLAGLAALAWDASDDPLNPRHGWKVVAQTEPTTITGAGTQLFLRTQAQASGYLPLDAKAETVIAVRFKLGAILNGALLDLPASRRFYAGGGGSVRGYAYQAIGPRLSDNTPQGGVSLAETSVELRRHVIGPWSAAAFVDFGGVGGNGFPAGKDFSAGAGFGVRYDLGFGPIRADFAFPLQARTGDPKFQIYISIGQSF